MLALALGCAGPVQPVQGPLQGCFQLESVRYVLEGDSLRLDPQSHGALCFSGDDTMQGHALVIAAHFPSIPSPVDPATQQTLPVIIIGECAAAGCVPAAWRGWYGVEASAVRLTLEERTRQTCWLEWGCSGGRATWQWHRAPDRLVLQEQDGDRLFYVEWRRRPS